MILDYNKLGVHEIDGKLYHDIDLDIIDFYTGESLLKEFIFFADDRESLYRRYVPVHPADQYTTYLRNPRTGALVVETVRRRIKIVPRESARPVA